MIITPVSWNGNAINNGTTFEAWFDSNYPLVAPVQLGLVTRAQQFPKLASKRLSGITIPLYIKCLGTAHSQVQTLKMWFDPYLMEEGTLVVQDIMDSNRQYYWTCTVQDIPEIQGEAVLQISLFATEPILRTVAEVLTEQNVSSSGAGINVTVGGNSRAKPRFVITPTGAKSSNNWGYRRFIQIVNDRAIDNPTMAFDITGGGMNLSALVSAGQLQSDLRDLRVLVNGAQVDWWASTATASTSTLIFVNLPFAPMKRFKIAGAIAGTGAVTDITVEKSNTNYTNLKAMPSSGILVIDTERFTYTGVNPSAYKFTGCTRAAKESSMGAHTAGTYAYWVQHDIYLMHGNSAATAQVMDDAKAPMFEVSTSNNGKWDFLTFADKLAVKSGEWRGTLISSTGKQSYIYTGSHGDRSANPATVMGMTGLAWLKANRWQGETIKAEWELYHPAGINKVSCNGEKYRKVSSFPTAALQRSQNGADWVSVWTETTPSAANTWEAWTHQNITMTASEYVRFYFSGGISSSEENQASFEVEAVSVEFYTTNLPKVTQSSSVATYHLDITLTNVATGEWLAIRWPVTVNQSLIIDCENKEVTHIDGTNAFAPMTFSSVRQGWLDLLPAQTNQITYADTGTGTVNVKIYHRNRQS